MATPAQIAANRRNAAHSTGPTTATGKAAASANSFKHGLQAKQLVLPSEDPAALEALRADLIAEHSPTGVIEHAIIEQIATNLHRLQRAQRYERIILHQIFDTGAFPPSQLGLITRYLTAAERAFSRSLGDLRKQQAHRTAAKSAQSAAALEVPETAQPIAHVEHTMAPAHPFEIEIGFVSQNPKTNAAPAPAKSHLSHAA